MHPGQKASVAILSAPCPQHPVKAKLLPSLSGQNSWDHLNSFLISPTFCGWYSPNWGLHRHPGSSLWPAFWFWQFHSCSFLAHSRHGGQQELFKSCISCYPFSQTFSGHVLRIQTKLLPWLPVLMSSAPTACITSAFCLTQPQPHYPTAPLTANPPETHPNELQQSTWPRVTREGSLK